MEELARALPEGTRVQGWLLIVWFFLVWGMIVKVILEEREKE